MWTTGSLKDSSLPIKLLHKCCLKQARILPNKLKDDKEIENEGLFTCMEPEDSNSHGTMLRELKNAKNGEAVTSVETSEDQTAGD